MIATKVSSSAGPDWEGKKAKFKVKFPKLTAEDLNFDHTQKFEMLTNLQFKLGMTTKELQVIIEKL